MARNAVKAEGFFQRMPTKKRLETVIHPRAPKPQVNARPT